MPAQILGQFTEIDPGALQLWTKARTFIRNAQMAEASRSDIEGHKDALADQYPYAVFRTGSATYNCAGLVLASRRTYVHWDRNEELIGYLEDDGYRPIALEEASIGDVVLYKHDNDSIEHIAIVVAVGLDSDGMPQFTVISKWGLFGGEYLHDSRYVDPILGTPTNAMTDKHETVVISGV